MSRALDRFRLLVTSGRPAGGYLAKSLPPLEFEYTQPTIDETVQEVDPESLQNLPYGLDSAQYQWVDLDGEGLPGILTEQAGKWFYKRNPLTENWRGRTLVTFETLVELIGHTQTATGLRVKSKLDTRRYKTGIVDTTAEMRALAIDPHHFHGDWNYAVRPRAT